MNTIIPNKLRSDWNLNDLPNRAVSIERESLSLFGSLVDRGGREITGKVKTWVSRPGLSLTKEVSENKLNIIGEAFCPGVCATRNMKWASESLRVSVHYGSIVCLCE